MKEMQEHRENDLLKLFFKNKNIFKLLFVFWGVFVRLIFKEEKLDLSVTLHHYNKNSYEVSEIKDFSCYINQLWGKV